MKLTAPMIALLITQMTAASSLIASIPTAPMIQRKNQGPNEVSPHSYILRGYQ